MDMRVQEGVSVLRTWIRTLPEALSRLWTGSETSSNSDEALQALPEENRLRPAPDALLDRIAPPPDWSEAVSALDTALRPWTTGSDDVPALVLMPGYHNAPPLLKLWAEVHTWTTIAPVPRPHIMQSAEAVESWFIERANSQTPWVLPRLERCYIRTPSGLAFVRRLLDHWTGGSLGRGIIGCDPHAWTYLQQVWAGAIPHCFVLKPFSANMLARWFRTLAELNRPDGAPPVSFHMADRDSPVLPERHEREHSTSTDVSGDEAPSPYLRMLAAYSQGDPNIAWLLWRQSLLTPADALPLNTEDAEQTAEKIGRAPDPKSEPRPIIWVPPWSDAEHPKLSHDATQRDTFVLHALLLHGGLSADQLCSLLPMNPYAVRHRLHHMHTAGIITQRGAEWHLTPVGYAAACDMLRKDAYLPDPHAT